MNVLELEDYKGKSLIIKFRKSAVFLEKEEEDDKEDFISAYKFNAEGLIDLLSALEEASDFAWKSVDVKEADSEGSDYFEYYDKDFDSNGCIHFKDKVIKFDRPNIESSRLYKFDKKKMGSFIYDIQETLGI